MQFINKSTLDGIATVALNRGKVHAFNEVLIDELRACFEDLENDNSAKAVILTGTGNFFSFGFDVPEFYDWPRDDFKRFLTKFNSFVVELFMFGKPVVAAINGHAVAGGSIPPSASDYRVMVGGKAKIGLTEVAIGASLFAGTMVLMRYLVGGRNAERIVLTGKMFSPEEALELGLIDQIVANQDELMEVATKVASDLASVPNLAAYAGQKKLIRGPIAEEMIAREPAAIEEFLDIWYLPATREALKKVEIRG